MRIVWKLDMKGSRCQHLLRDRAHPLLSTDHVGNFHKEIIDHDCTMIGRDAVRFQKYLIIDFRGIELETPHYEIIEKDFFRFWDLQANRVFFS